MCYEPFNKSAADRYIHAQRRARRDELRDSGTPSPDLDMSRSDNVPIRILQETEHFDWAGLTRQIIKFFKFATRSVLQYRKELGLASAIIFLGVLTIFYLSPTNRLQMFGGRFRYSFPAKKRPDYLVMTHLDLKSWSERQSRLDTPLGTQEKNEIGHIVITPAPAKSKKRWVLLQARDWIINQSGVISQTLPMSHPSLAGISKATFDKSGVLIDFPDNYSSRLGRLSKLVIPQFPTESVRPGDQWDESVEWVQAIDDWKVLWKGQLHWESRGLSSREGKSCMELAYRAEMTPHLWETPAWARGAVHGLHFSGTSTGRACFDTRAHQLLSNDLATEGALRMELKDIYRIPIEMRVGREPRRRWGHRASAAPGTLILDIHEKLDVHRS
jgi:hypothetical protein